MNDQISPIRNLWFGFAGAIAVYVFIGYQNLSQKNKPIIFESGDLSDGLFAGAVILALLLVAVAHFLLPKLMQTENVGQKMVLSLLQFALSEVAGIIGIILFIQYESFAQLIVLCLIAFVSLLKLYPQNLQRK